MQARGAAPAADPRLERGADVAALVPPAPAAVLAVSRDVAVRFENTVSDARDPHGLGRFWASALGGEQITDEPDLVEARPGLDDGSHLDLRFPRVASPSASPARVHLDLAAGARQDEVVVRLLALGAHHVDTGQGQVPQVVLADPEGGASRVVPGREAHQGGAPIAAVVVDSADPSEHLLDLGATSPSAPGDLPWRVFADPSGDESCVLGWELAPRGPVAPRCCSSSARARPAPVDDGSQRPAAAPSR